MKTALCFLLTLFLASAVLPSYAESDFSEPKLDLESLSDDQLLSVKEQVELEFLRRTEHFTLDMTPGVYVVGKNIAEGRYRISHSEGASYYFFIYDNYRAYEESDYRTRLEPAAFEIFECDLNSGNVVRFTGNTYTLEKTGIIEATPIQESPVFEPVEGTLVETGTYVVGETIPAGNYQIYYNGENATVQTWRNIKYYNENASYKNLEYWNSQSKLTLYNTHENIILADGMVLVVLDNSIIMTKRTEMLTFD